MARGEAGRRGKDVRSDCWIAVEEKGSGGISLKVKSKVESMYGDSIRETIEDGLKFFAVRNAVVEVEDQGALPFGLTARLEAAVRRLNPAEALTGDVLRMHLCDDP
jgi:citrate lyase acyl carrier protein